MRRDTGIERIGRLQPFARQRQIGPEFAGTSRQEVAPANIGKQPNSGFRHRKDHRLACHPMAAVHRHADAATHHNAMQQRDRGLAKVLDSRVQPILIAIELERIRRSGFT